MTLLTPPSPLSGMLGTSLIRELCGPVMRGFRKPSEAATELVGLLGSGPNQAGSSRQAHRRNNFSFDADADADSELHGLLGRHGIEEETEETIIRTHRLRVTKPEGLREWLLPDWDDVPVIWNVPSSTRWMTWVTMALLGTLCLGLGISAGVSALAAHKARRGPPIPSYRRDGSPTLQDTCSSSNPRTYCGAIDIDKAACEAMGCCWWPLPDIDKYVPSCFRPNVEPGQYKVISKHPTGSGYELKLELRQAVMADLGPDLTHLTVLVEAQTRERLHIKISPDQSSGLHTEPRWEVPTDLLPRPVPPEAAPPDTLYHYDLPEVGQDFSIEVHRQAAAGADGVSKVGPSVFSTKGWGLVFKEQYMQVSTSLDPSSYLFGLGEYTSSSGLIVPRNGKVITLWTMDYPAAGPPDLNLYGAHPFYIEMTHNSTVGAAAAGVFLLNSNGMDIEVWKEHLTYRVTGGVLDFYVFLGPTPEQVTQQYHQVIGLPALPALWTLGWHQCRWGYRDLSVLMDLVKQYDKQGLPLDVVWSDIDYMNQYRLFTLDPERYPPDAMKAFIDGLHAQGKHWVPIQDPAVQYAPGWQVWDQGVEQGVFIRDAQGQQPYIGQVWAGPSAWPDFFNPAAAAYWSDNIAKFRQMAPADGLWLDMNEASNFCGGDCHPPSNLIVWTWRKFTRCTTCCLCTCKNPRSDSQYDNPPYAINNLGHRAPLQTKSIPATARHYNGWLQYNTHNLYGFSESKVTWAALAAQTNKRPFLLSRSTFPGLGHYSAHWTGDNAASWENLRWSIPTILASNMWGIPLVGADICGFFGETYEELCARWIETGAFYPFSRNHGDPNNPRHEAYVWPLTRLAANTSLTLRYRLLPYLYTAFHTVHSQGGTVARPLIFHWPTDEAGMWGIDTQWMMGDHLMVAPILWPNAPGREVHFPQGVWYRLVGAAGGEEMRQGVGKREYVDAPIGKPSVWARAGAVLPMAMQSATTTQATMDQPLCLLVTVPDYLPCAPVLPPPASGSSLDNKTVSFQGTLYADDGISLTHTSASQPVSIASIKARMQGGCGLGDESGVVSGWLHFSFDVSWGPEAGRKLHEHASDQQAWQPYDVRVQQVHIRGAAWCSQCGSDKPVFKQLQVKEGKAEAVLDKSRAKQDGQLSDADCTSGAQVQYDQTLDILQIRLDRSIPLLCVEQLTWRLSTAS